MNKRILTASLFLAATLTFLAVQPLDKNVYDTPHQEDTKVAVVVLDGADWKPVNQLREKDRVPNIESFIQEGVYGDLVSPTSFSPISWTKAATGKSRENTSIQDWNTESDEGNRRMVRREDVSNKRIWDYLNQANKTAGVSSWLLTWPVEEVSGFMISGPLRTADHDLYYPEHGFNESEKEIIEEASEWEEARMSMERKEDVDFLALGMKNLDVIQHHLWKFVDPEPFEMEEIEEDQEYREVIYTEYEKLDEVLADFDEDWNVMVFGTSGFEAENKREGFPSTTYALNVNPLIEELGYGNFTQETTRGTTLDNAESGTKAERCPLEYPKNDVINETTMQFRMCVLDDSLDIEQFKTDFKAVKYRDGTNLIKSMEYREETEDIISYIRIDRENIVEEDFREAPTNQPLVDDSMPYIDPALGLELPDGRYTKLWIGPEKSGDHPPGTDSIFLAKGPAFEEGKQLDEGTISMVDIAPTVLYMYGLPIPEQMDGRPVLELFREDFRNSREVQTEDISTHKNVTYLSEVDEQRDEVLSERLRDIGYMVRE